MFVRSNVQQGRWLQFFQGLIAHSCIYWASKLARKPDTEGKRATNEKARIHPRRLCRFASSWRCKLSRQSRIAPRPFAPDLTLTMNGSFYEPSCGSEFVVS